MEVLLDSLKQLDTSINFADHVDPEEINKLYDVKKKRQKSDNGAASPSPAAAASPVSNPASPTALNSPRGYCWQVGPMSNGKKIKGSQERMYEYCGDKITIFMFAIITNQSGLVKKIVNDLGVPKRLCSKKGKTLDMMVPPNNPDLAAFVKVLMADQGTTNVDDPLLPVISAVRHADAIEAYQSKLEGWVRVRSSMVFDSASIEDWLNSCGPNFFELYGAAFDAYGFDSVSTIADTSEEMFKEALEYDLEVDGKWVQVKPAHMSIMLLHQADLRSQLSEHRDLVEGAQK